MKHYAVNFNIFGVSPDGAVAPLYTQVSEERYTEKIPECEGKHPLVALERSRIVSGDFADDEALIAYWEELVRKQTLERSRIVSGVFADDKALIAYLEELVRKRTLCETLGVQFRRVPDSLRQIPAKIEFYRANMKKPELELAEPSTYDEPSCEVYAKRQETRALWLAYIQSVIVK